MEEQKTKVNKWKKIPKFFKIWIILFSLALTSVVIILSITVYNQSRYTITYVGIDSESTHLYATFNINSSTPVTIDAKNFSVMINNTPYNAIGFYEEEYSHLDIISDTTTISVKFNKILINSNDNLHFYYKGKLLELGDEIKFKI